MEPGQKVARIAGVLYLVIMITAGFSEGVVRSELIVPGDAAETAAKITAREGFFRLGFVSDLIAFMADAVVLWSSAAMARLLETER